MSKRRATIQCWATLALTVTAPIAWAQGTTAPTGKWQSPGHVTYTNPFLAGDELYLDIDVAKDGSFRGTWSQYFCTAHTGAYGVNVISCSRAGGDKVTGRFGPANQGAIDLVNLGRSAFTWKSPAAEELAIDLPEHWQAEDEGVLYRARLTRDGKPKPPASSPAKAEGPPLSAVALYREFRKDENAALKRHAGTTPVLEGLRGTRIDLSSGGVAIHVPDGFTSRALVLTFDDPRQVEGMEEGAKFSFKCTVASFDYQYVHLDNCTAVR
jgi:hypothetical protein